jgi:hypothetical protein
MISPEEKAKKLFDYYYFFMRNNKDRRYLSIQCALIAVDEIIEVLVDLSNGEFTYIHNVEYWQEVKQEIEKL